MNGNSKAQTNELTHTFMPGFSLSVTDCIGDPVAQTVTVYFTFLNETNIDRSIEIYGGPRTTGVMADYIEKSVIFDENGNQYDCKDDFWFFPKKELPANLKLKGMLVFSNVLPSTKLIGLAKLSIAFAEWEGNKNGKRGVVQFKNLTINWNAAAPKDDSKIPPTNWDTKIQNLNNGLDFTVSDCIGNAAAQTVTVFFTFANPRKANQKIELQKGFYDNASTAFDMGGNQYPFKSLSLAGKSDENQLEKELLTGLTLKGSITFSNILPSLGGLAMAKIPVTSSNWDGGGDQSQGIIEVHNVKINWVVPKPIVRKKSKTHK